MNGNGLNTIGLKLDVILGLFWTKVMIFVGLSMEYGFNVELGLGQHLWTGPILWTSYGLDRTLLA